MFNSRKVVVEMKIGVGVLIILALFSVNGVVQEHARWGLPDGANVRFGKGRIAEIEFSPSEEQLAVASSTGVWLYDTSTLEATTLLTGNTSRILSVSISPGGGTLAGASLQGVHLWI